MLGATNSEKHGKKGGCLHSQVTTADGENTETFPMVVVVPMCVTCLNRSNISFSRLFVFGVQQLRRNSWKTHNWLEALESFSHFRRIHSDGAMPCQCGARPAQKCKTWQRGKGAKHMNRLNRIQSSFMNSYGLYWFVVYCMEKIQGVCLRRRGHRNAKLYNMYCLFSS